MRGVWLHKLRCMVACCVVYACTCGACCCLQALQAARQKIAEATAALQQLERSVAKLEVAIPKLQLEAGSARQQADDLQHRLSQLSQATQVGADQTPFGSSPCP